MVGDAVNGRRETLQLRAATIKLHEAKRLMFQACDRLASRGGPDDVVLSDSMGRWIDLVTLLLLQLDEECGI